MNAIYQNMLSAYDQTTEQQQRNAVFEVNQQIILPDYILEASLI
jgi:hypothetical protein